MSQLSKADEQRIMDALTHVRGHLNSGMEPNDAICKVASELQIRPNFVQVMVNAVNTGLTNEARMDAGDDHIKAAETFPLADASTILTRLYPDKVKSAAVVHRETVVSDVYTQQCAAERFWTEKVAEMRGYKPNYNVINGLATVKPAPYPRYQPDEIKEAHATRARAEYQIEVSRRETQELYDKLASAVGDLTAYFRNIGSLPYNEVRSNCEKLFGKQAAGLVEIAGQQIPARIKAAEANFNRRVDVSAMPYSAVRTCLKLRADYATKKAEHQAVVKEATATGDQAMRPFVGVPLLSGSVLDVSASWLEKLAEGLPKTPGDMAMRGFGTIGAMSTARGFGNLMGGVQPEQQEGKILDELLDPAHEAEIRNIQAQAMLSKLMGGAFSRYNPQDVLDAYNRVSPFIPEGAQHEALVQDAVQKQLGGGPQAVDIFTIGQLADINKNLREARKPSDEQLRQLGFGYPRTFSGAKAGK